MDEIASAAATARRLYSQRRRRDRLLGAYSSLMGESAWDLLLALFGEMDGAATEAVRGHTFRGPEGVAHWTAVLHRLDLVEPQAPGATRADRLRLSSSGIVLMTRVVAGSALLADSAFER